MLPVWDASGKYLWFLASTDFGLRSQWLDMTSYDREENFGLYLAVLKKGEPSPLLPESDEDTGESARRRGGRGRGRRRRRRRRRAGPRRRPSGRPRRPRRATPVTVQIDFDGLQQRIISVPGVPERAVLAAPGRRRRARSSTCEARRRRAAAAAAASTLHRYRLSDRQARRRS